MTTQTDKYKRLKAEAEASKKKADYAKSPKGMAIETIKGLPTAAKIVGKAIASVPRKIMGDIEEKLKIQQKQYQPKNEEDRKIREQNLKRLKEAEEKWKAEHPGKAIPK